jgi:hypothetical protein
MRRTAVLVGVVCFLIAGCSMFESPSSVARKFYAALEKNDTEAIKRYATPDTVRVMAMFGSKMQGYMGTMGKITGVTETIDGDTAVVTVSFESGEQSDLDMIKTDGKWKVNMTMNK